jgi:hypothetical protein
MQCFQASCLGPELSPRVVPSAAADLSGPLRDPVEPVEVAGTLVPADAVAELRADEGERGGSGPITMDVIVDLRRPALFRWWSRAKSCMAGEMINK